MVFGQENECDPVWIEYGTYKNNDKINVDALGEVREVNAKAENCEWTLEIVSYEVSINNEVVGECVGPEICKNALKKLKIK